MCLCAPTFWHVAFGVCPFFHADSWGSVEFLNRGSAVSFKWRVQIMSLFYEPNLVKNRPIFFFLPKDFGKLTGANEIFWKSTGAIAPVAPALTEPLLNKGLIEKEEKMASLEWWLMWTVGGQGERAVTRSHWEMRTFAIFVATTKKFGCWIRICTEISFYWGR